MNEEINEGFKRKGMSAVEEHGWGMYVWQNPEGDIFADDEGNVMNVFCMKGDRKAIQNLIDAAKYWGAGEGKPVWWGGKRRIDDEELEYQQMRERMGLVADPLDVGALRDEAHARRNGQ
jgi:hypothetical protein